MKNIKELVKRTVVPAIFGAGVGIFVVEVVGPAFNLDILTMIIISGVSASALVYFGWTFIEKLKKIKTK